MHRSLCIRLITPYSWSLYIRPITPPLLVFVHKTNQATSWYLYIRLITPPPGICA